MRHIWIVLFFVLFACGSPGTETEEATTDSTIVETTDIIYEMSEEEAIAEVESCPCTVQGYLIDTDNTGTFIRQTPGGEIIDTIYHTEPYTGFEIMGADGKWLQVAKVFDYNETDYTASAGGWIFSQLVGTSTSNYNGEPVNLYADPTKDSDIVDAIPGNITYASDLMILECCDRWVYISVSDTEGNFYEGWLEPGMQCPNPVTNCS